MSMESIPAAAFQTALGINGLTVLCVAWILKDPIREAIKSRRKRGLRYIASIIGLVVLALAVILSVSLALTKALR